MPNTEGGPNDFCVGSYDLRTQVGSSGFFCTGCRMKDPPMDEEAGTVLPHYPDPVSLGYVHGDSHYA